MKFSFSVGCHQLCPAGNFTLSIQLFPFSNSPQSPAGIPPVPCSLGMQDQPSPHPSLGQERGAALSSPAGPLKQPELPWFPQIQSQLQHQDGSQGGGILRRFWGSSAPPQPPLLPQPCQAVPKGASLPLVRAQPGTKHQGSIKYEIKPVLSLGKIRIKPGVCVTWHRRGGTDTAGPPVPPPAPNTKSHHPRARLGAKSQSQRTWGGPESPKPLWSWGLPSQGLNVALKAKRKLF